MRFFERFDDSDRRQKRSFYLVNDNLYHYYGGVFAIFRLLFRYGDRVFLHQYHTAQDSCRKGQCQRHACVRAAGAVRPAALHHFDTDETIFASDPDSDAAVSEDIAVGNYIQGYAAKPNEKWLTDVTEFKWYDGNEIHKLYLSAILDLCDRRIVSYVLSERNDNPLVFKTFDKAVQANPDAHPLLHSDGGFQYTNRTFHYKLVQAGMTQSMSRVAHCIDNGPMEGFWGILKRERYYGRRFTSKRELVQMIETYVHYYNTRRVQRNLGVLTPMEKHELGLVA